MTSCIIELTGGKYEVRLVRTLRELLDRYEERLERVIWWEGYERREWSPKENRASDKIKSSAHK